METKEDFWRRAGAHDDANSDTFPFCFRRRQRSRRSRDGPGAEWVWWRMGQAGLQGFFRRIVAFLANSKFSRRNCRGGPLWPPLRLPHCVSRQGRPRRAAPTVVSLRSNSPRTKSYWNTLKIFENAQLLCAIPLQTGDAKPCPAQLPLSRATDHIESRVM